MQANEDQAPEHLADNPFLSPRHVCVVNQLPPELLSQIFEFGVTNMDDGELESDANEADEDEILAEYWNKSRDGRLVVQDENTSQLEQTRLEKSVIEDTYGGSPDVPPSPTASSSSSSSDSFEPVFQVLVSHVCRHWREVALSTPSLWTNISVTANDQSPFDRIEVWLIRSKTLPIDIFIDSEPLSRSQGASSGSDSSNGTGLSSDSDIVLKSMSESDLAKLLDLLIPHVPRWLSFHLDAVSYPLMFTCVHLLSSPSTPAAECLRMLELYHHEDTDSPFRPADHPQYGQHLTLFDGKAPRLQSIALWGVHVDWSQGWLGGNVHLVDLELAYHSTEVRPSWAAFSCILRESPNLETLTLSSSGPAGEPHEWGVALDGENNASPVELNGLKNLVLAYLPPSYVIGLLRRLVIPCLQSLALDIEDDCTELVQHLVGPGSRSSFPTEQKNPLSSLENLKLAGLPCDGGSVSKLYSQLDGLISLNLDMNFLTRPFFQSLSARRTTSDGSQNTIYLPALSSLTTCGISGDEMRELVTIRKEAGHPLKTVFMDEADGVSDQDISWLREHLDRFDMFASSEDEYELEWSEDSDASSLSEAEEDSEWEDV